MSTTFVTTALVHETCCRADCGVPFGIESNHQRELLRSHANFYCPNGHSQHYTAKTEAERERELREQRERELTFAREQRDRALNRESATARRLIATKGVVTRIRRRVAHGVCPCCQRTFANLARHMAGQHPDFADRT